MVAPQLVVPKRNQLKGKTFKTTHIVKTLLTYIISAWLFIQLADFVIVSQDWEQLGLWYYSLPNSLQSGLDGWLQLIKFSFLTLNNFHATTLSILKFSLCLHTGDPKFEVRVGLISEISMKWYQSGFTTPPACLIQVLPKASGRSQRSWRLRPSSKLP